MYTCSLERIAYTADLMRQIGFLLTSTYVVFFNDSTFASLLFAADQTLFKSTGKPEHCLHSISPSVKTSQC
jgi:hypothetical protein